MLMNDFYTIEYIQRDPNSFSCKVAFNNQHDIFKSHTTGRPVVPGVCMIEMVKELLEQQTDQSLWLKNAGQVKMFEMVTSDIRPIVNISWQKVAKGYSVDALFTSDVSDVFQLSGNFESNK
jgi:3-hydroxyacyl-[acyl-carrier-protein] dehydratase